MAQATFKVTTSPRVRYFLAALLLHPKLKEELKDRTKQRALYRARKQLGLMEPSEWLSDKGRVGEIWRDGKTLNVFEVSEDSAAFIVGILAPLEKEPYQTFIVEELMQQLEAKTDAPNLDMALPFDEGTEAPLWKPTLKPSLVNPERFTDVLCAVAEGCLSFGQFREKLIEALKLPETDAFPAEDQDAGKAG